MPVKPGPSDARAGQRLAPGGETRTALLQAAEELFSEHGYAAVGIRDIAALARTNVSSIKYHFGSKRRLYLETMRWLLQHPDLSTSWEAFDPLPSTRGEAVNLLALFIRRNIEQAASGGRAERCVRLMVQEGLRPGEDFAFITATFSAPYERLMVELVRKIAPGRSEVFYVTSGRGVFAQVLHYQVWKSYLERSEYGGLGSAAVPASEAAAEVTRLVLRGLGCSEKLVEKALS